MIKAIFFDIDGTLLSHKMGRIPESTILAIRELQKKGILIFTATGRCATELCDLPLDDITFDGYVLLNGQLCLDKNKNMYYGSPISSPDSETFAELFQSKTVPCLFFTGDSMYINYIDERVKEIQKTISSPLPPIGQYQGEKIYQVDLYEDKENINKIFATLKHCKMDWWHESGIDIFSEEGGKTAGIQKTMEHYHLLPEEIMAFGDGSNDREMLAYAGIGIAMGNASLEVQSYADYVTLDIDEDGIFHALTHFGLLDPAFLSK